MHQYSIDVQRELRGDMAVTVGYIGSTGRDLGYRRVTTTPAININQIDPARGARGVPGPNGTWDAAALRAVDPEPVLRRAGSRRVRHARRRFSAGQLLRPFPQFGDVLMSETTEGGKRQYHAVTFKLDKRTRPAGGAAASTTPGAG